MLYMVIEKYKLNEWAPNWNDVTEFEFVPVISSQEMSEKMVKND